MKTVKARWYTKGRISPVKQIVIHDMEAPEGPLTAENVANYFHTTDRKASAHICVDNNSEVRCVSDEDTAWAAPGANASGLQLEIAGYARQTFDQWTDAYSSAALTRAAKLVAAWCRKYDIPVRHLTDVELAHGSKGIVGHADVSRVFRKSDHSDPGTGFPWKWFLAEVRSQLETSPQPQAVPAYPGLLKKGSRGTPVRLVQRELLKRGYRLDRFGPDSHFGDETVAALRAFQRVEHITVDGQVGPSTWGRLFK